MIVDFCLACLEGREGIMFYLLAYDVNPSLPWSRLPHMFFSAEACRPFQEISQT